jgi:glycosyltransferase involved in cell wall biosynthesis
MYSDIASTIRVPLAAPEITPWPPSTDRPLWSVMIPTYNCSHYLQEAIQSVLAQDMGPAYMQIEVVDDASTDDDVELLVASMGGRVQYYRQPVNVGSLRNFETCLNRSRGYLVHLLHSDDRVLDGFYAQMTQLAKEYPEAGAVFSRCAIINETGKRIFEPKSFSNRGILQNWLVRIATHQYIQYASIAVRREVYEHVGGFYGTNYGEDWEMWVRIARYYPMAYTPDILAEYRGHASSITSEKARTGQVLTDLLNVIASIQKHVPDKDKQRVGALAKKRSALLSLGSVYNIVKETGKWSSAQPQIKQVLAMSRHPAIYYAILKTYLKSLMHIYTGRQ